MAKTDKQGKCKSLKAKHEQPSSQTHNPKVAGSNPAPATNFEGRKALISFELRPSTLPLYSVVNSPIQAPTLEAYLIALNYRNTPTSCLSLASLCSSVSHDSL